MEASAISAEQRKYEQTVRALTVEYLRTELQAGLTFVRVAELDSEQSEYARTRAHSSYAALRTALHRSGVKLSEHPDILNGFRQLQRHLLKLGELDSGLR